MSELYFLATKNGTDKGGHGYCPRYEEIIGDLKSLPLTMIEIGVSDGCSLRMWRDWMPKAKIYGMDVRDYSHNDEGITVFTGDQSKPEDLERVSQQIGKFHFLVDDASHNPPDQKICFDYMWPRMEHEGWYVIEDLNDSKRIVDFLNIDSELQSLHFFSKNPGSGILFLKKK